MVRMEYGPFSFASGINPSTIQGPSKDMYVVEHQIPGAEGGITEYIGSMQTTYSIRGFIAPPGDNFAGVAGAVLSGSGYVGVDSDGATQFLRNIRISGTPQLLRIESTATLTSGYPILYENDFFWMAKSTFGFEPGKNYPYYPYSFEFKRASTKTYGSNSGASDWTVSPGWSGYIYSWRLISGLPQGEIVAGLGMYAKSVASGNAKMAIYDSGGVALMTQTASQPINSGWNYFPLNPTFTTSSGTTYMLSMKSDAVGAGSGWVGIQNTGSSTSGTMQTMSGQAYASDFPASLVLLGRSGVNPNFVMVVG